MAEQSKRAHGVMEGKGAYNRYAKLSASAGALALPQLEKAARSVAVESAEQPVVVADYGPSQGKNSLAPVCTAIRALRSRIGARRPIFVFHIDQPTNDFNTLFEVLALDPDSYARKEQNVYPCAIGRSFYESVLPAESVHLGWCSYAAVWLSRIPARIPGHFIALHASDAGRHEFERQAAEDWKSFVTLRGRELAREGRLVAVLPARADDGSTGFENIMDHANEVLSDMVCEGAITTEEREEMTIGAYPRQKSELSHRLARAANSKDCVSRVWQCLHLGMRRGNNSSRTLTGRGLRRGTLYFFGRCLCRHWRARWHV